MTEEEKCSIVADLINLTPRKLSEENPSKETCSGYTHRQLFDLGLHSRYSADLYVYKYFFSGTEGYQTWHTSSRLKGNQAGVHKRRVNRVWQRIEPSIQKMWREGDVGIYSVSYGRFGSSGKLGHIHAKNKEEAIELAKVCFSYLLPDVGEGSFLHVSFVSTSGPDKIEEFNSNVVKDLNEKKKHIEDVVKSADKDLERIENVLNALKIAENIMKKV